MTAPLPDTEDDKLAALRDCEILDTPPEADFDDLTQLAAHICGVPIAAVSLIDRDRQWFKSILGLDATETSRGVSFCAHTILQPDVMIVPDAIADRRFFDNALVTGEPNIRFYAGAPLITAEGHALGSLCVIDRVPRQLTEAQESALRVLSRQVSTQIERHRRGVALERLMAEREAAQEALRAVVEGAPIVFYATDRQGVVTFSQGAGLKRLGLSPEQVVGQSVFEMYQDSPGVGLSLRRTLAGENVSFDVQVNGLCYHNEVRPQRDGAGIVTGVIGVAHDMTERKQAEERSRDYAVVLEFQKGQLEKANEELAALATTDGLTGLLNHRTFQERLTIEVSRAARYKSPLSLVLLDVDAFKQYNDTFGHPAGDAVLRQTASILKTLSRTTDLVARYGGEEFVLILPQTDAHGAMVFAERLREAIERQPWPLRAVTASFGVATLAAGAPSGADMIARADKALYQSKAAGRNRVMHSLA